MEGDTVRLNLAPFIEAVKQRLVASGFGLATRIPQVNASFVLALVFWGQPTGKTILVLAGLLLVALALIESLNQPPHPPSSPPQPRPEPDSGGASTPKRVRPPLPCWLNG